MIKTLSFLFFATLLFVFIPAAHAETTYTEIEGKVTDSANKGIQGVSVIATCTHKGNNYTKGTTTSGNNGIYSIKFTFAQCRDNDPVTVVASKDGKTVTVTGEVHDYKYDAGNLNIDRARFLITFAVPEFSDYAMMAAFATSIVAFFFVRRKLAVAR